MTTPSLLDILLLAGSVHIVGLVSPGPDFALILRNSVSHSQQTALWSAFGIALGVLVHIAYTLTGLSIVIAEFPIILNIVAYIGVGYLFWLGFSALRGSFKKQEAVSTSLKHVNKPLKISKAIMMGFVTNVTNPKAIIYFVSFLSTILAANHNGTIRVLLGAEVFFLTWLWFSFLSFALSHRKIQTGFQKYRKIVDRVVGILFLFFSISMLIFITTRI